MIHAETSDLVQRNQDSRKEEFVLFLQRQSETVDYRAQDLEKLRDAVESLCLVDELKEDVVD